MHIFFTLYYDYLSSNDPNYTLLLFSRTKYNSTINENKLVKIRASKSHREHTASLIGT